MKSVENRAQLLLALLFAGEKETGSELPITYIDGITRLEKLVFLLVHEAGFLIEKSQEEKYNFIPFKMGPWTNEIYDEIDFLESIGLVNSERSLEIADVDKAHSEELFDSALMDKYQKKQYSQNETFNIFKLTEEGKRKALILWNKLPQNEKAKIIDIKKKFNNMSLKQLLRYVYKKYPEFTEQSEIKDSLNL